MQAEGSSSLCTASPAPGSRQHWGSSEGQSRHRAGVSELEQGLEESFMVRFHQAGSSAAASSDTEL